jgi:hypothetical protein
MWSSARRPDPPAARAGTYHAANHRTFVGNILLIRARSAQFALKEAPKRTQE